MRQRAADVVMGVQISHHPAAPMEVQERGKRALSFGYVHANRDACGQDTVLHPEKRFPELGNRRSLGLESAPEPVHRPGPEIRRWPGHFERRVNRGIEARGTFGRRLGEPGGWGRLTGPRAPCEKQEANAQESHLVLLKASKGPCLWRGRLDPAAGLP